jgi:hypothetical protein
MMMSNWLSSNGCSYNSFSLSTTASTTANNTPLMPALPVSPQMPLNSLPRVFPPLVTLPKSLF